MSVHVLRALVFGAQARGIGAAALCEGAGVPRELVAPEVLGDPDARVPARHVVRLWEFLPRTLGDESFGLTLSALAAGAPLSVGWWIVWSSPTLREGLIQGVRYQRLLHDQARSELLWTAQEGIYRHRIGALPQRAPRHAIEFGFATFARFARRATGRDVTPSRVSFQHAAPRDLAPHRAVFGSGLQFGGDHDELVYDSAALDLPLLTADASLREVVEAHARQLLARFPDERSLDARLRAAICDELKLGRLSLERVATRVGLPPRTLQRRLKADGASFASLCDDLRHELARGYLRDGRFSIQETAFMLGFSDVSAFHRAFVRWTGITPRAFQVDAGATGRGRGPDQSQ